MTSSMSGSRPRSPASPFLPEERWRAVERDVRDQLLPGADTWVMEDGGALVAFMSVIDDLIGGLSA